MKKILLLCLLQLPLLATAMPALTRLGLKEALDKSIIKVEATATGNGYHDKSLHIHITNLSGNQLLIKMELGTILRPADTAQQDLVLAGEEVVPVEPFKDASADVQTFCAKSYATAPHASEVYKVLKMSGDPLIQLLQYIKMNHLFDDLGQEGVWVMTNNHPLESVYDAGRDLASVKLAERISQITGQPIPKYYEAHEQSAKADGPVYNSRPSHIYIKFEQKLDAPAKLTLGVFNEKGDMVQKVFENQSFGAKVSHRYSVDFPATDAPAGTYYVRLKNGETVLQEQAVVVH